MMMGRNTPLIINGWTIFAHPVFLRQVNALAVHVEGLRAKHPQTYKQKSATKRLAAVTMIATELLPKNPDAPQYRQGAALGANHRHWFRVKFFQQYRLFFRFDSHAKIIILGWVNDEHTKRAYDSKSDAYRVFAKMLDAGRPPDDWAQLLAEAKSFEENFE